MVNEKQKIEELQNLARYKPNEALIAVKWSKYPYFMAARVLELDILKPQIKKVINMHSVPVCKRLTEMFFTNI